MTLDCEVVTTRSGALAMRDRVSGEVMHPVVGPRVEAKLLYVGASRLEQRLQAGGIDALVLLDVGLGAGSNAIAAFEAAQALNEGARKLSIVSFDQSSNALECALEPQHAAAFGLEAAIGQAAHAVLRDRSYRGARVDWRLELGTLPDTLDREPAASADMVYWDPFSPAQNPTLWTRAAFLRLHRVCRAGATLFTYSAATATRSALLLAGFAVGEGPITGVGKTTTQAALGVDSLEHPLGRRFLDRLTRSSAPLPSDAPQDALERIRALPQFASN